MREGNPNTKHIFAGDVLVASKFVPSEVNEECPACVDRASVLYFHGDQLGSTTFATDETQTLTAHEQYFPSGELWVDQASDTAHTKQPYLFAGKELDVETGLYYFGARYYDPRIGIWTSPDPILAQYIKGQPVAGVFNPSNLAVYTLAKRQAATRVENVRRERKAGTSCQTTSLHLPWLPRERLKGSILTASSAVGSKG